MMQQPLEMDLKDRMEQQIAQELCQDTVLRELGARKQNEETEPTLPYLIVNVTVGSEISPGANIFNASGTVEAKFDTEMDGQKDASYQQSVVRRIEEQLKRAQAAGTYGLILEGEQTTQFSSDTIRSRFYGFRLIAG